jgi:hypothetical protein
MIEFELSPDHPFVLSLNKMLNWVKTSDVPNKVVGDANNEDLSEERLLDRINNKTPNYCRMSRFDHHKGFDFSVIEKQCAEVYREKTGNEQFSQIPVAKTWYPAQEGYLGWHIDQDGDRFYSAFAEGKSFFRYRDPVGREIITSWDKPGQWTFRIFNFDKNNPTWHCVKAYDLRVSIGYRFVLN